MNFNFEGHSHRLRLEFVRQAYECNSCKEVGFDKRCSCPIEECDFNIHYSCVSPPRETRHHLCPQRTFLFVGAGHFNEFVANQDFYCHACGLDIKGSFYYSNKCRSFLFLHPCCVLNQDTKRTSGEVTLFLRLKLSSCCYLCGLKELWNGRNSWGYVSDDGEYQFHLFCVKKRLIDNWQRITCGAPNEDSMAIVPMYHNHHSNANRVWKRLMKTLSLVASVIIGVFTGNPTFPIITTTSMILFHR